MNIDNKILIPLIGVILGWFLSTISNILKTKGEKRRLLGKSISQLYYLTHELRIVIYHLEKFKDNFPVDEWEKQRQKAIERYTLKNENSLKNIDQLIDDISSISPSIGIELKFILEQYVFDRNVKFDSSQNIKKIYIYLLSILETSQELTLRELEKILIQLSFKYSFILGFKIKRKIKMGIVNLESDKAIITDNLYDLLKEIKKPSAQHTI